MLAARGTPSAAFSPIVTVSFDPSLSGTSRSSPIVLKLPFSLSPFPPTLVKGLAMSVPPDESLLIVCENSEPSPFSVDSPDVEGVTADASTAELDPAAASCGWSSEVEILAGRAFSGEGDVRGMGRGPRIDPPLRTDVGEPVRIA